MMWLYGSLGMKINEVTVNVTDEKKYNALSFFQFDMYCSFFAVQTKWVHTSTIYLFANGTF